MSCIDGLLDAAQGQNVAIVGLGHLGRAITVYSAGRWPKLSIVAAFDNDPAKVGQVINGCTCYQDTEISRIVAEQDIRVAIITVPASEAQKVADTLVEAGVKGILNFAPARLRVPPDVYVENMDVAVSLEKVAYFARQGSGPEGGRRRAGDGTRTCHPISHSSRRSKSAAGCVTPACANARRRRSASRTARRRSSASAASTAATA